MSTWLYLVCESHTPALVSVDEVGQHLYDLPRIREEIANFDKAFAEVGLGLGYFEGRSYSFLRNHRGCKVSIVDEYGKNHPTVLDDEKPQLSLEEENALLKQRLEVFKGLVDELDVAREEGRLYTYGQIQQILRKGLGE